MADHSHSPTTHEVDPATLQHVQTFWSGFTRYTTFGVLGVVAVLVLMAIFLV